MFPGDDGQTIIPFFFYLDLTVLKGVLRQDRAWQPSGVPEGDIVYNARSTHSLSFPLPLLDAF